MHRIGSHVFPSQLYSFLFCLIINIMLNNKLKKQAESIKDPAQ